MASPAEKESLRRDRISDLTNDVLGHVLSFLPNKEAGRAAALARRWRYIFGSVHDVSFAEEQGDRDNDWYTGVTYTYYGEAEERKSCSDELLDGISAALLCRRRCAGLLPVPPLRSLRFAFDSYHWFDKVAVDQWLAHALSRHSRPHGGSSLSELHLDLRFCLGVCCSREVVDGKEAAGSGSDDDYMRLEEAIWTYVLPRRLFSCTALRTLCVTGCRLKLPAIIDMPFLETLHLAAIADSGRSIQRLISSCPRLADLTLEALNKPRRVTVRDKRLRRFALLCCHNIKSIDIDASELNYRGAVPLESLLPLHGSRSLIPSWTIDLCDLPEAVEFAGFARFLDKISHAKHLQLGKSVCSDRRFFAASAFPLFSSLTCLTLEWHIRSCETVGTLGMILEQTPNLEVLSLLMLDGDVVPDEIMVHPEESSFSIPCLRRRVREISMKGYKGSKPEKMLAKLLLCNALVLERLHVVFVEGFRRSRLEIQMTGWAAADSEKTFI